MKLKETYQHAGFSRTCFNALLFIIFMLLPLHAIISRDSDMIITITGADGQRHTLHEGYIAFITHGDSIVYKSVNHHPEGDSRIIVQFESPPLASQLVSGMVPLPGEQEELRTQIRAEQQLFLSDLARIERMLDVDTGEPYTRDSRLHFVYEKAFNGVSLTAQQAVTDEIQSLPYVMKVHADERAYALIEESIGVIGADDIWSEYNVTGEGVVVGILDTGIDYMHPDLGGGLGPEYKVMGGYDFVSHNDDPMDDHGHGTHVAGIVAANGQLQGVAPGARLVGYKVLNHEGIGYYSWIIAGIEQSVIDGVDILNVSLGGDGSPDDPMSQAIDNASAAGVLCVVSAGNSGPGYYTIGSPGVAKRALTVGATHLNDDIASFSSKGPVKKTYDIKPDVMAPGVQINAPVLNAGYQQMSGTSMSAPHVAGAAALLLAEYPDLTPDQVKSIFSQSATGIGLDVWSQGMGRIDLQDAFQIPDVLISPSMVSFGLTDLKQDSWSSAETIYISSMKDADQWITLSMDDGFPAGAEVSITPAEFPLQAGETKPVEIILTVNTLTVPFPEADFPSYMASLNVEANTQETNIPLTFVKSPGLHIYLDEKPEFIIICGQHANLYIGYAREEFFPLPPGNYDIYIQYDDFLTSLIFENVPVEEYHEMHLTKQDAKNHVEIVAPDINGDPIITKSCADQFYFHNANTTLTILHTALNKDRYFTDFDSTRWIWGGFDFSEGAQTMHIIGGSLEECLSDTVLLYEPNELVQIQLDYKNASNEHDLFSFGTSIIGAWHLAFWDSFAPPLTHPFRQDLYFSPGFKSGPRLFGFYVESYAHTGQPIDPRHRNPLYKTSQIWLNVQNQPMLSSFDYTPLGTWQLNTIPVIGETVSMDLAPPSWNGKFYHQEGNQLLMTNFYGLFQLQKKGVFKADQLQYALHRDGVPAGSGDFYEDYPFFDEMYAWVDFEPGDYELELVYDHYVIQGQEGVATARMGFETGTNEGFIPRLSAFNITYEDAYYTDIIGTGEEGIIKFVAEIYEPFIDGAEITLEYRAGSDTEWHYMNLVEDEGHYNIHIPGTLPQGYISLRIQMVDNSGSFLEYTVEPAFLHTEVGAAAVDIDSGVLDIYQNSAIINSEVTEDGGSAVTERGVIWCTSEYPDIDNHLGFTADGEGLGRFKSQVSGLESNTAYYVRAYATNSLGLAYSEPFMLDQIPDCLPPKSLFAESVAQTSATIGWNEAGDAQIWDIVYGYEGFDPDAEGYILSASYKPYQITNLQHSAAYDFYVRSHCNDESSEWSKKGSFTTECDTPVFVFQTPGEGEIINITTDITIPYSYYFFGCEWVHARLYIVDDNMQHYVKYLTLMTSGFYEDDFEAFETLPSGTYRLRLRYTHDEQQHILEGNEFEIINDHAQLELVRPRAGNYFVSGYQLPIRWNALNSPLVNIDYSLDLGQSWSIVEQNVPSPDGYASYGRNVLQWLIPAYIEGSHPESLIRIASTDEPDLSSTSAPFIISDNLPVNIIAPKADSHIQINENIEITIEVLNPSLIHVFLGDHEGFVDHIASFDAHTAAVSSLEELRGMPDDGTEYRYTGEAVIVAMDDFRNRKFLQDETAAIMIDDHQGMITTNYDLYDVITNVAGQITTFNNMVQLQPTRNTAEAIDNRPADPAVFSLDAVTPDDQARLIRFNDVQFTGINTDEVFEIATNYTIFHGTNVFQVRTNFWEADYIGEPIPHGVVDIAGVLIQYGEALQLVPRFASDIGEPDIAPLTVTFSADPGFGIEHNITEGFNPAEHNAHGKHDGWSDKISLMDIPGQVVSFTYNTSNLVVDEEYYVYVFHENSGIEIPGEFFTISDVLYELLLSAVPPGTGDVTGSGLYAENEEVVATATPSPGYRFTNWSGDVEYIDDPYSPNVTVIMPPANIQLAANFEIITHIPMDREVSDQAVSESEVVCFDALQTITVSDFAVEAGGSAELIAGESIHLLPGTTVEHGGYLLARIAAHEDDYCGIPRATEVAKEPVTSKEDVVSADFPYEIRKNGFFKIYPNPTDGTFTLELTTMELEQNITVEVHSMLGGRLFTKELPPQRLHTLSLEGQQPGMYIIQVMKGEKVGVERLIKR